MTIVMVDTAPFGRAFDALFDDGKTVPKALRASQKVAA